MNVTLTCRSTSSIYESITRAPNIMSIELNPISCSVYSHQKTSKTTKNKFISFPIHKIQLPLET